MHGELMEPWINYLEGSPASSSGPFWFLQALGGGSKCLQTAGFLPHNHSKASWPGQTNSGLQTHPACTHTPCKHPQCVEKVTCRQILAHNYHLMKQRLLPSIPRVWTWNRFPSSKGKMLNLFSFKCNSLQKQGEVFQIRHKKTKNKTQLGMSFSCLNIQVYRSCGFDK